MSNNRATRNREAHLAFRATLTERRAIQRAARRAGLKPSEFLRVAALEKVSQVFGLNTDLLASVLHERAARPAGPSTKEIQHVES